MDRSNGSLDSSCAGVYVSREALSRQRCSAQREVDAVPVRLDTVANGASMNATVNPLPSAHAHLQLQHLAPRDYFPGFMRNSGSGRCHSLCI